MIDETSTAIGTPNIALIKYWGKRDEKLILPTNSNLSLTLDESLNTKTSVTFSDRFKEDRLYINGQSQDFKNDKEARERWQIIDIMRNRAGVKARALSVSSNSFPTASGLASSASGAVALALAASDALGMNMSQRELSIIARQSSGSSCRSVFGGFVRWNRGTKEDGSDSDAEQIADEKHWKDFVDIAMIVSSSRKRKTSRATMKQTVATSPLYKSRLDYVEGALKEVEEAIREKDFETVARIVMKESNNMHAVILDTYPPILYLNDVSKEIIYAIHDLNDSEGRAVAAYTFDAGPNPHIFVLEKNLKKVKEVLSEIEGVEKMMEMRAGAGPRLLGKDASLISDELLNST
jgi:diphosphomevalonate decarboxylase